MGRGRPAVDDGCVTPHVAIGAAAMISSLVSTTIPLLQVRKMWRERSAHGLSLAWACFPVVNGSIWTLYAFSLGAAALEVTQLVYVGVSVVLCSVTLHLRRRYPAEPATVPLALLRARSGPLEDAA